MGGKGKEKMVRENGGSNGRKRRGRDERDERAGNKRGGKEKGENRGKNTILSIVLTFGLLYSSDSRISAKFDMREQAPGVLFRAKYYLDRFIYKYNDTLPHKYDQFWIFRGLLYSPLDQSWPN